MYFSGGDPVFSEVLYCSRESFFQSGSPRRFGSRLVFRHGFQGSAESKAKQQRRDHPIPVQPAKPSVRSPAEGIDATGALEAAVRAAQPDPQKTILGLELFKAVPVQLEPPLVGGFQKLLTDRVNGFYLNRFHRERSNPLCFLVLSPVFKVGSSPN